MSNIKVRFILEIPFKDKETKTKYLTHYGEKFFSLVKEAKSKKYLALDYGYLPGLRKLLNQTKSVEQLIPHLESSLSKENMFKLLEVSPMFNLAPIDLKAYILLSLGLRKFD